MIILLMALWLAFSAGLHFAEHDVEGGTVTSYLDALYWGIAAFSTAGIADSPHLQTAKIIGGIWIIPGSAIFFGTIIATYFMRALQRPARKLIDAIEYNMEKLKEHQSNTTQL